MIANNFVFASRQKSIFVYTCLESATMAFGECMRISWENADAFNDECFPFKWIQQQKKKKKKKKTHTSAILIDLKLPFQSCPCPTQLKSGNHRRSTF